jgi:putative ABC transport system substrate-binding protein
LALSQAPGGNITGINIVNAELAAKRMELLRELVPRIVRIAVLVNPGDVTLIEPQLKGVEVAARAMGLQIQIIGANTADEIDAVFGSLERERPDALFAATTPFLNVRRVQLVQLAAFHRLPATYAQRDYVQAGGLMSYGSNIVEAYRQLGIYAGRILKGEKPADLPVEHATKFELAVNHRTARMLGLAVPPTLIARADEVIE